MAHALPKIFAALFLLIFAASLIPISARAELAPAERAALEAELAEIEKEIEAERASLSEKQREKATLERDVAILDSKINKAKLGIRARDIVVSELLKEIDGKVFTISDLSAKIEREKESLEHLMRKTYELDSYSLAEVVLSNLNISDFFTDLDTFLSIKKALNFSFTAIALARERTSTEKELLERKKNEENELKNIQLMEKKRLDDADMEKKQLLRITKGQEASYQKVINEKEKDAAAIRSALFNLRGSKAISFEEALAHAEFARSHTGIRPAFLLGIIREESNLGAFQGNGNWRIDMYECYKSIGYPSSAEKQKAAYLAITGELGFNPDDMPVSKAPGYGCGGAMGPAQFMPTTWMGYKNAISGITGSNPPNPWNPRDAFVASTLLLKDNGGADGGSSAERRAALRYLAGGNWQKPAYAFYGDEVMGFAEEYQRLIDILESSPQ
ncbi:lytic murein transglycosylase [bacterium]|nr:lytic murein transglycosylase [bacterium]